MNHAIERLEQHAHELANAIKDNEHMLEDTKKMQTNCETRIHLHKAALKEVHEAIEFLKTKEEAQDAVRLDR